VAFKEELTRERISLPLGCLQGGQQYQWLSALYKGLSPQAGGVDHFYLTQCIKQMVLESQAPHKTVNLLFTITN
jgi:hypothetical protein